MARCAHNIWHAMSVYSFLMYLQPNIPDPYFHRSSVGGLLYLASDRFNLKKQHYYPSLQVAGLDAAYTDYIGSLIYAEFGLGEIARDLKFLQDNASSIHDGLVEHSRRIARCDVGISISLLLQR